MSFQARILENLVEKTLWLLSAMQKLKITLH